MGQENPRLWDAILAHLRRHHPSMCRRWFDDIEVLDVTGGTLRLLVREPVQLGYLRQRCRKEFTEAAQAVLERLVVVDFVDEQHAVSAENRRSTNGSANGRLPGLDDEMLINPDHTFEHFVVGPTNRLAHAAATAVASKPAWAYNPFFVHSAVGLGKTHLLQAICQAAVRKNASIRIYYTSCNGFMTQFHDAVRAGEMGTFRHRFRDVDMLIIDDIHDLSCRDSSQEEFFHTFNALTQTGRQVVLSSDAAPNQIPDLEERLTSRFNCGLVAEIERPGFETRVQILKRKAALRDVRLPDDVASYVASRLDSNIRELEGAITKMQGIAALNGAVLDMDLARQAIGRETRESSRALPSIQQIADAVVEYYGLRLGDLLSKRRHKSIVLPRQVCMWLTRHQTRHSLQEIGGFLGGRDHTTVMHGVNTIDAKRHQDPDIDRDIRCLERRLLNGGR